MNIVYFVYQNISYIMNKCRQEEIAHLLCSPEEFTMDAEHGNENVLLSVDETIDYKCGLMWFKPDWLQRFRTAVWSLIFISCGAFLQGKLKILF